MQLRLRTVRWVLLSEWLVGLLLALTPVILARSAISERSDVFVEQIVVTLAPPVALILGTLFASGSSAGQFASLSRAALAFFLSLSYIIGFLLITTSFGFEGMTAADAIALLQSN